MDITININADVISIIGAVVAFFVYDYFLATGTHCQEISKD